MANWYTRAVLAVRDAPAALGFYSMKLGFSEDWRYEEEGRLRVVQVSRAGCELILSDQWPDQAGRGLLFISLDRADLINSSRSRGTRPGPDIGIWGYDLMVVEDPDGNAYRYQSRPTGDEPLTRQRSVRGRAGIRYHRQQGGRDVPGGGGSPMDYWEGEDVGDKG